MLQHRFVGGRAIVTGGAGGIGRACVSRLYAEGCEVVVFERGAQAGAFAAFCAALPPPALPAPPPPPRLLAVDVSVKSDVEAGAAAAFGGRAATVLVNNAAAFRFKSVDAATDEDWDECLSVNIKGYANCMAAVLPGMRAAGSGAIVNVASVSAFCAQNKFVPYATSKAAQVHMSHLVAADEGASGVRVNTVAPGFIRTEATEKHARGVGQTVDAVVAEMAADTLLGRMGRPEEVAAAIAFLASADSSFITGTTLLVDGGTFPR